MPGIKAGGRGDIPIYDYCYDPSDRYDVSGVRAPLSYCKSECIADQKCTGMNYNASNKACQLQFKDVSSANPLFSNSKSNYYQIKRTYSYPVKSSYTAAELYKAFSHFYSVVIRGSERRTCVSETYTASYLSTKTPTVSSKANGKNPTHFGLDPNGHIASPTGFINSLGISPTTTDSEKWIISTNS